MFPERGEEFACDFGNFSVMHLGELIAGIYSCQVFERCIQKNLVKLDSIAASTMNPISYFGNQSLLPACVIVARKISSIFPFDVNQNPEQCVKEKC